MTNPARLLSFLFALSSLSIRIFSFLLPSTAGASQFVRRSSLGAQKFDASNFISVSVLKPLGLSLEEVEENGKRGVVVEDVNDGNAKLCGKIYKGLFLVSANGRSMKNEDFETVLDTLRNCPESEPVELVFIDPRNIFRGPALLTVNMPSGKVAQIKSIKGQPMREVLMSAKINVHGDRANLTNCGGGGQCGTCAVLIEDADDWDSRAELEGLRLKKYPSNARLSCRVNIEGDCTVTISPSKLNL